MAANVYMKSLSLGMPQWTKLATTRTVVDATIIASILNASAISLRFAGGVSVSWPPGATAFLRGVDLSQLEVRGSSGHAALVAGCTPRPNRRRVGPPSILIISDIEPGEPGGTEPGGGETGGGTG